MTEDVNINENSIPEPEPIEKSSTLNAFLETLLYMVAVFVIVVIIRYVFVSPFAVEGSSMEPNLHTGELILVNKIGYATVFGYEIGAPQRGDVVIINPPDDPKKFYVKRVIALPNETIEFHNGAVIIYNEDYLSGVTLAEDYLSDFNKNTKPPGGLRNKKIEIPARQYYVLGDNRNESRDSRSFGPVHEKNVVGKTEAVIFPVKDFRGVSDADYSF